MAGCQLLSPTRVHQQRHCLQTNLYVLHHLRLVIAIFFVDLAGGCRFPKDNSLFTTLPKDRDFKGDLFDAVVESICRELSLNFTVYDRDTEVLFCIHTPTYQNEVLVIRIQAARLAFRCGPPLLVPTDAGTLAL